MRSSSMNLILAERESVQRCHGHLSAGECHREVGEKPVIVRNFNYRISICSGQTTSFAAGWRRMQ